MTPEYRAEKEASIVNLGGGGIWEINAVTAIAPAAALIWAVLQTRQGFFKPYGLPAMASDFLIQCAAILFATTVYASAPEVLTGFLVLPAVAAILQPDHRASKAVAQPPKHKYEPTDEEMDPLPVKPFITTYRGAMMIITCASILAVDFPVFPRRFAKTESFGTSLMDLGVGSFVFAAGIVAARQQLKEQHTKIRSFSSRMISAMRHSLPLFALGVARLISVKNLDYYEHVSEYGVHWNFFFTLALLPPVIAIIQPVLRYTFSYGILAFAIGIVYELCLYCVKDLKIYIILSERKEGDWLSQNREGVFSFVGYLAIFIAGMGIGMGIMPRDPEEIDPRIKKAKKEDELDEDADWLASVIGDEKQQEEAEKATQALLEPPPMKPEVPNWAWGYLLFWTGLWTVFAVWALWQYGPGLTVSRRMANLGYIVWVCAFNTSQLLMFCGIERIMFPNLYKAKDNKTERQRIQDATSKVLQAFNRNGLAIFLLANLLTGLINMTVPTLHMTDVQSMAILLGYMATLCGFALALDHYNISIKL
ncbi:hypothetical protein R9X50_00796600 [Acrodontium crateriforme]|uniref:GPI-anchored wall transfer protein n=1 Tax=Acrodontium crateriforme TaxID=150365 RepID=A0AAQ3MAI2_9PEZI|nr:hypothetical protein R9X50_00796600 [Acrodontium crateriforme]